MSYFYYRSKDLAVVHRDTGARVPYIPDALGRLVAKQLKRLRGVRTKEEAQAEIISAVVQVAADAVRKCK